MDEGSGENMRCLNCMQEFDGNYSVCPHCGYISGSPAKEPFQLPPGTMLQNRYLVGTAVGVGGFGITYIAYDTQLQQVLAVKEYYPSANGIVNRNPGEARVIVYSGRRGQEYGIGLTRFLEEARCMAKFSTHPNIVHVYDFFQENGTAYITMEFLDGISYKEFIKSNDGRIPVETAIDITLSVLNALKEVHANKIIHRDISPDNVHITKNGTVKLIDFGAARISAEDEEKTRSIILKPGYSPPEQYQTKSKQGPWTDIYAVGAMLYRALTGRMPDESTNRVIKDELPEPKELRPEISDNLNNAILRAMAVNQELRFRNVDQFAEAIREKKPVASVQEVLHKRRKNRFAIVAVIAALLIAAAGVSAWVFNRRWQSEHLSKAAIEMWIPVREDQAGYTESLLENFRSMYSKVTINVTEIPEAEYESRLRSALESGNVPTIFDSTCLGEDYNELMCSMDEALERLEESRAQGTEYLFAEDYERLYPDHKKLPTGIHVPIVYTDKLISEDSGMIEGADSLKTVISKDDYAIAEFAVPAYELIISDIDAAHGYEDFLIKEDPDSSGDAETYDAEAVKKKMIAGKVGVYLSDSSEYRKIQEDMAGIYNVRLISGEKLPARFTGMWSVSASAAPAEKAAALRLAAYFLSQSGQEVLNVSGGNAIPLEKSAFTSFQNVNHELDGLDESIASAYIAARDDY